MRHYNPWQERFDAVCKKQHIRPTEEQHNNTLTKKEEQKNVEIKHITR